MATSDSNTSVKFADNTAVVGLISNNDETAYRAEINCLVILCEENNLKLNLGKTKEWIVDFSRKQQRSFHPLSIYGAQVERVDNLRLSTDHSGQMMISGGSRVIVCPCRSEWCEMTSLEVITVA